MAKKSMIEKQRRKPKFRVRPHNCCKICGRPRGYLRKFGKCVASALGNWPIEEKFRE